MLGKKKEQARKVHMRGFKGKQLKEERKEGRKKKSYLVKKSFFFNFFEWMGKNICIT